MGMDDVDYSADLAYHKAAAEAAQNGQKAAMKLAEARSKELVAVQQGALAFFRILRIGVIITCAIVFLVGLVLGGWLF
jgi:hypothetical protein